MGNMEDYFSRLEAKKNEALISQDGVLYVITIEEMGISEENMEDYQLYQRGLAEINYRGKGREAERKRYSGLEREVENTRIDHFKKTKSRKKSPEEKRREYQELLEKNKSINYQEIFADTEAKREILRDTLCYKNLYGENKKKISLDDASPARVGKTYRNAVKTAEKFLDK